MKTALKIFIVVIIILLIFFITVLFLIDFDFDNLFYKDKDYQYKEDVFDFNAKEIAVEAENRLVKFEPSSDNRIKVAYYESSKDTVYAAQKNDKLSVYNRDRKRRWFVFDFVSANVRTITIWLPQSFEGDINVETSNGSITLDDIGTLVELDLTTSNGKITLEKLSAKQEIKLSTSNGNINIKNVSCYSEINASTSNGKLNIEKMMASRFDGRTSNGKVIMKDINCNNIKAHSSNGSITLHANGNKDDFEIRAHTNNFDKITLDEIRIYPGVINEGKAYRIDLSTSNGDIEIKFI